MCLDKKKSEKCKTVNLRAYCPTSKNNYSRTSNNMINRVITWKHTVILIKITINPD